MKMTFSNASTMGEHLQKLQDKNVISVWMEGHKVKKKKISVDVCLLVYCILLCNSHLSLSNWFLIDKTSLFSLNISFHLENAYYGSKTGCEFHFMLILSLFVLDWDS